MCCPASLVADKDGINISAGTPIQSIYKGMTASTGLTGQIPEDNSKPQIGEGAAVVALSTSISPTFSTSSLGVELLLHMHKTSGETRPMFAAVFRGTTADAVGVWACQHGNNAIFGDQLKGYVEIAAGTTASLDFSVRVGCSASTAMTINGNTGAARFGGVFTSSLRLVEIKR